MTPPDEPSRLIANAKPCRTNFSHLFMFIFKLIGSGSTYIWAWCDANYKEGMSKEE